MGVTSIKKFFCLLIFCLGVFTGANAQLTVTGEIRPRAEFRNGFKTLNTSAHASAFFIEQRSRIYLGYRKEKIGFQLSLQDVRIWGNTDQIYKADPALTNVYEAWGEYYFAPNLAARVGRQALDYDNARFLGDLDWAQQGRSHDAIRLIYSDTTNFSFHIGAAYNQNVPFEPTQLSGNFYAGINNYKTMQYTWLHKEWDSFKMSLLIFNDGRQKADSTIAFRQTYGLYTEKQLEKMSLVGEVYYQGGKDPAGKKVNAWLAAFRASFNALLASPALGIDYLSGSAANSTVNHSFDPLYGTNHKFYGFMDYFYVGNFHGQNGKSAGLIDIHLQTKWTLGKKSSLIAHLHHFHSPTKVYAAESPNETISSTLGEEIDFVYNLNLSPEVNLKVGYSQLFSTESLEVLKDARQQGVNQWAWAMFTMKPSLFVK